VGGALAKKIVSYLRGELNLKPEEESKETGKETPR
jgi:hypothetical protein